VDVRATCLNCMDGRVQLPVLHWIKEQHKVDFVDVITEAGMDSVLANQDDIHEILKSIDISVNINKSTRLFVVGHFDCRGNPVDEKTHRKEIASSVKRLQDRWRRHEISGLWVNSNWQVEVVV
jgi:carbonic anhydrase